MPVAEKFIVVEDRLQEMFDLLPQTVKPGTESNPEMFDTHFDLGDEGDLIEFIKENDSAYPLIWLESPYNENHKRSRVDFENISLIIAINSDVNDLNKERITNNFKPILLKVANDIKYIFEKSNTIFVGDEYRITKFYKYSIQGRNKTTAVWDALKVTFSGYMNNNCLKPITFRNV